MKSKLTLMGCLCLLLTTSTLLAQSNTQNIRGTIIDADSREPLIGANVVLISIPGAIGTSTDQFGQFRIENIPTGRHDLEVTYLSYETKVIRNLLLTSAKELVLNIDIEESAVTMNEVVISAQNSIDKSQSLNPFATVSSRTFSVEETSRYAASSFDPARMAQNFAGVSVASASSDLFNEIVIRGNSPAGVLWRLDGIEIPNPNHFGDIGNSGGAISMLSSTTLTNSDFYTGAFPSEFGNALSGVFDLTMRNGNNEKREYSFMFGALGLEFGLEGPLSKEKGSSYLINYRYSTLALLQATGINPAGEVLPTYQDLSFKFNFPQSKLGNVSLFGLAGNNLAANNPPLDSLEWENPSDAKGFEENGDMATVGLTHRVLFDNQSYLRTVIGASYERQKEFGYELDNQYKELFQFRDNTTQSTLRISSMFHKKISNKYSFRMGGIVSYKDFSYSLDDNDIVDRNLIVRYFDNQSKNTFLQGFAQWKYKPNNNLSIHGGFHTSLLTSNSNYSVEPRLSVKWSPSAKQSISLSSGLHSKMEHLALYSFEGKFADGNEVMRSADLEVSKAIHNVIAYDYLFNPNLRVKLELYHQHLYDIPIQNDPNSVYSVVNSFDIFESLNSGQLVSEGQGRNIGVDLTVEKFLDKGYYFMLTGSLYDSKYKTKTNEWYNTRFNGKYQLHLLGGKEFKVGKSGDKTLGFNGKFVVSGGARYSEVNLPASIAAGDEVLFNNPPYNLQAGQYLRFDWGINYRVNRKKTTHTFMFDIQNTTNRENPSILEYDDDAMKVVTDDLTGLFPFINYRIEF